MKAKGKDRESVTFAEKALIASIPAAGRASPPARILVAGNRSGRTPAALHEMFPSAEIAAHVFDMHHARAMVKRLFDEGLRAARSIVRCQSSIPEGPWDFALFMTTPRSMPAELVLDQLEDIRSNLAPGAPFLLSFEGGEAEALRTIRLAFPGKIRRVAGDKHATVFLVRGPENPLPRRSFAAEWKASLPGGEPLVFTSLPGCFCHRRADAGGLALAEVAARSLAPGADILDMGCGCGLVGLLLADAQRRANPAEAHGLLTLVDSHARAIEAARINAARAGIENVRFVLSDTGLPRGEKELCDMFVGNPPYYSEYRIAETFLSTAYVALRPGGLCHTVVKTASGLLSVQEKYFRKAETVSRRGYAVLTSVR